MGADHYGASLTNTELAQREISGCSQCLDIDERRAGHEVGAERDLPEVGACGRIGVRVHLQYPRERMPVVNKHACDRVCPIGPCSSRLDPTLRPVRRQNEVNVGK